MSKQCGYGCQLHHVTYCMIMAYATERTLILESEGWRYAQKGWETLFLPLSRTCTTLEGETNKVPWGGRLCWAEADYRKYRYLIT